MMKTKLGLMQTSRTLTTSIKDWPTRVRIVLKNTTREGCLEHTRSVSKERFIKKLGKSTEIKMSLAGKHLNAIFSE